MTFLVNGLAFFGGAVIAVVIIIVISSVLAEFAENRRKVIITDTESKYFHRLRSDAYWFSEDPPTMRLLLGLADGKSVDDLREQWRKERLPGAGDSILREQLAKRPQAAELRAGPPVASEWTFNKPAFVDSEDCMANPVKYWMASAYRTDQAGARRHVIGNGPTSEAALAVCKQKTRTKAEVLYARSKPGRGCCDTYCDNMSCDCLEKASDG